MLLIREVLTPSLRVFSFSRSETLIVFHRDVCLQSLTQYYAPPNGRFVSSAHCVTGCFSHTPVRSSESSVWNLAEHSRQWEEWAGMTHWWSGGRVAASASRTECGWMHQIRWRRHCGHIPSSRIVAGEGCWARPMFFLLSFRLSFRDSRRKRLSKPKVVLVLLMLLLLRTLSSTASAPSALSPVHKD